MALASAAWADVQARKQSSTRRSPRWCVWRPRRRPESSSGARSIECRVESRPTLRAAWESRCVRTLARTNHQRPAPAIARSLARSPYRGRRWCGRRWRRASAQARRRAKAAHRSQSCAPLSRGRSQGRQCVFRGVFQISAMRHAAGARLAHGWVHGNGDRQDNDKFQVHDGAREAPHTIIWRASAGANLRE